MKALHFLAFAAAVSAIGQTPTLAFTDAPGSLQLAGTGSAPTIIIDAKDWPGVTRAGNDVANDFGLVTGTKGKLATTIAGLSNTTSIIIAGTIGKSPLIDSLISSGKINVDTIKGKWESYTSQLVSVWCLIRPCACRKRQEGHHLRTVRYQRANWSVTMVLVGRRPS
jgi:hypothetical protein